MNMKNFNEILFSIYIYIFTIMAGIIYLIPNVSFILLLIVVISMLMLSLFYNRVRIKKLKSILLISLIMSILFSFDLLFRRNETSMSYMYYFIIFGLIPIYLYAQTEDKNAILKSYSKLSAIIYLIYFWDPLVDYKVFNDYMSFGFNFALPVFCGVYIGRKYFKYKWMLVIEILSLIELIVFSNKGAALAGILVIFLYNLLIEKLSLKQFTRILVICIIALLIAININEVLNSVIKMIESFGLNSYSLSTLNRTISAKEYTIALANRDAIWEVAMYYFRQNMLIGLGTGGFESITGIYSHNVFIDVLVQYGILGAMFFITIITKSLIVMFYRTKQAEKVLGLLMLCLWIIPLSTSMIFYKSLYFWVFIFFAFIRQNKNLVNTSMDSR